LTIPEQLVPNVQTLVEGAHLKGDWKPRIAFVCGVNAAGRLESINRVSARDAQDSRRLAQTIRATASQTGLAVAVGRLNVESAGWPGFGFLQALSDVDARLDGSVRLVALCHASTPLADSSDGRAGTAKPVLIASNHMRWTTWRETHQIAAFDVSGEPLDLVLEN